MKPVHPADLPYIFRTQYERGAPITICTSRYGGTYEGAAYVAFPLRAAVVGQTDFDAEDAVACAQFWAEIKNVDVPVGRGDSPDDAMSDLQMQVGANGSGEDEE